MNGRYKGPPERPASIDHYYSVGRSYTDYAKETLKVGKRYTLDRYMIESDAGLIKIDYFRQREPSKSLVFIFPVLGGKNIIEAYFADYMASHGLDAAIVHRVNDFKDPKKFDQLETILRNNLVRDRIALDFFEKELGKTDFASFGISRGAINVAMTAGVDKRLKYNVLVMGGTDLINLFRDSNQNRIRRYIDTVRQSKGLSEEEFYDHLRANVKTDPKYFAGYMDARNTLLILSALDQTVPFKYGMKLRRQIGNPRTIVLLANHYTSILYTQFVKIFPPERNTCLFPFDFIEGEALDFYKRSFTGESRWWHNLPLKALQAPLNGIAYVGNLLFGSDKEVVQEAPPFKELPLAIAAEGGVVPEGSL